MRRMTQRQGLVASLENEDLNTPADPASTAEAEQNVEIAEAGAELSDELTDVTDAAAEGETNEAEVEEATEVAEALESIAEAVGVCAQNGGLNQHAANAIGIAVQHMYDRVGLESVAMPALESFGSTSGRIPSTNLAMEDIKQQAANIWQKIVEAIQRAYKWAVDFFNKIFGAGEKLIKRAEALQTKVEGITGGKPGQTEIENDKLAASLAVGGKVAGVNEGLKKIELYGKNVFNDAAVMALGIGEEAVTAMEKEGAEKTFASEFTLKKPATQIGKPVSNPESVGFSNPPEGLTLYRSEELPGGRAIISVQPSSPLTGEAALKAIPAIGAKMEAFDPKAKPAAGKIATLSTRDALEICKNVVNIGHELIKFRDGQGKLNEMKKKFEKAATGMAKKSKGSDDKEARAGLAAMAKVAGKFPSLVDQPAAGFSAYLVTTCKAALDYVDLSMKQYSAS